MRTIFTSINRTSLVGAINRLEPVIIKKKQLGLSAIYLPAQQSMTVAEEKQENCNYIVVHRKKTVDEVCRFTVRPALEYAT